MLTYERISGDEFRVAFKAAVGSDPVDELQEPLPHPFWLRPEDREEVRALLVQLVIAQRAWGKVLKNLEDRIVGQGRVLNADWCQKFAEMMDLGQLDTNTETVNDSTLDGFLAHGTRFNRRFLRTPE